MAHRRSKLTAEQMVKPIAIAPFEVAHAFRLWSELYQADVTAWRGQGLDDFADKLKACCDSLGPPYRLHHERPQEFGERCACALAQLIKEI